MSNICPDCGHERRCVIGQYYQCPVCDIFELRGNEPEETPDWEFGCAPCGTITRGYGGEPGCGYCSRDRESWDETTPVNRPIDPFAGLFDDDDDDVALKTRRIHNPVNCPGHNPQALQVQCWLCDHNCPIDKSFDFATGEEFAISPSTGKPVDQYLTQAESDCLNGGFCPDGCSQCEPATS